MPAAQMPDLPCKGIVIADEDPMCVVFRDRSTLSLFQVSQYDVPARQLRAVRRGSERLVVDMGKLSRELDADLRRLPARDAAGVIHFTLRGTYTCADEALNAMTRHAVVALPGAHA